MGWELKRQLRSPARGSRGWSAIVVVVVVGVNGRGMIAEDGGVIRSIGSLGWLGHYCSVVSGGRCRVRYLRYRGNIVGLSGMVRKTPTGLIGEYLCSILLPCLFVLSMISH